MYVHTHVCLKAWQECVVEWISSLSTSQSLLLSLSVFLCFLLILSCLYLVISVPPGNFKEGTYGLKRFPSPPGCWYLQTPFGIFLSDASSKHTPLLRLISLCAWTDFLLLLSVLMFWSAASAATLATHTRWDDEMVCSTAHRFVHDLILLTAILASAVQTWKVDVLVVNRGRPFPLLFCSTDPSWTEKKSLMVCVLLVCLLLPEMLYAMKQHLAEPQVH